MVLMDIYRETILDHYKHPRHFGELAHPDKTAEMYNATCGDRIKIDILFSGKGRKRIIKDVRFTGNGCAISQASASLLTDHIIGRSVEEVKSLGLPEILEMLGTTLTPSRVKCAILPLEVLESILTANRA